MLPKENRLKKKKDFEKVVKEKEKFETENFLLKKRKNDLRVTRIGLVIRKKVAPKAVIRNKIKRKTKECLRQSFLKKIKRGYDLVFFVKKRIDKIKYKGLQEEIEEILKKGNLI
jgi:ribonuclease P protein component